MQHPMSRVSRVSQALLEAAQAGGPLSVLQDSRQGGPRDHEDIAKAFAWIAGHLLPKQLHALSSLALFRWALSGMQPKRVW